MTGAEILLGLGIGATVLGTMSSARSQRQEASMQAGLEERNAQIAEQNADMEIAQSRFNAGQIAGENARLRAKQRAAYGASGVTPEGSPLLVEADAAAQDEIDQLAARYEGDVAATRARSEAGSARYRGQIARVVGANRARETLITGFGKAAGAGMGFFGRGGSYG